MHHPEYIDYSDLPEEDLNSVDHYWIKVESDYFCGKATESRLQKGALLLRRSHLAFVAYPGGIGNIHHILDMPRL